MTVHCHKLLSPSLTWPPPPYNPAALMFISLVRQIIRHCQGFSTLTTISISHISLPHLQPVKNWQDSNIKHTIQQFSLTIAPQSSRGIFQFRVGSSVRNVRYVHKYCHVILLYLNNSGEIENFLINFLNVALSSSTTFNSFIFSCHF